MEREANHEQIRMMLEKEFLDAVKRRDLA